MRPTLRGYWGPPSSGRGPGKLPGMSTRGVPEMTWTSLSLFAEQTGQQGKGRGRSQRRERCQKRSTECGVGGGSRCAHRPGQAGASGNRWAQGQGPALSQEGPGFLISPPHPGAPGTAVGSPGLRSSRARTPGLDTRCSARLARAAAPVQSQSDRGPWAPSPVQSAGGTVEKRLPGVARGRHDTHTCTRVGGHRTRKNTPRCKRTHGDRGGTCSCGCAGSPCPHSSPGHPHTLSGLRAPGPGMGFLMQQAFWKLLHSFSRHGPARLTGTPRLRGPGTH